jgi:tyrosine-specific transport protein
VLSASLLVTGNTVGAGCLVLPELAAGPGLAASSAVFGASYLLNLLSGLTIARIAVEQHEQKQNPAEGKGADPQSYTTSSFQDLARSTLGNGAGALVSSVSLLVNAAVLCFDMGQVGREVGERLLVSDAGVVVGPVASAAFAGTIATLLANLPTHRVSDVASVCVAVLFASFGGLLLSSSAALASAGVDTTVSASSLDLQGLMASAFFAPGASSSIDAAASGLWGSLGQAAPVIFMSMVYQNIVPSVVKMLDYNMNRVTSALSLGSFLPLCLYLVWCVVGSGASSSLTDTAGPLLALFTASTLVGSALGTGMSLVEEVQALHSSGSAVEVVESEENDGSTVESCPSSPPPHWGSVAISFGLPLVTALALGEDRVVEALEWAGSFGSPLLYGVLPAAMAFRQRQQRNAPRNQGHEASVQWHELFRSGRQQHPFVYSLPSLGVLGVISTGFIGEELVQQVSSLAS